MIGKKEKSLVAAQKLVERGQLDKAIAEFAKVVADDPKDTRTWLKMAELHAKLGANAEAAAIYVRTGELYTEQGLSQKAVAVYKNALKLAPGVAKAHLKLGALYKQLGLGSDAVQQLELAAAAFTKDGAPAEAATALRQAVALDGDNAVLRVKLAEAASLGGLVEEAVREFGRAADQLKAQGRLDESLRVLERLLFHQPDNTTKAREVAEAYITRGSPRLALPKLQACLNADPREPRTLFLLARALEQLGQKEKAVSVLTELARLYQDLGRWSEREAAIARALAMAPSDGDLRAMAAVREAPASTDTGTQATPPPTKDLDAPQAPIGGGDSGGVVRVGGTGRVAISLGVGETGARAVSASSGPHGGSESGSEGGFSVARVLAESEVFVKYGMLERAAEHLARVFEVEPENREAREKLSAVYQQLGRPADAARHLDILAQQLARTDPTEANRAAGKARFLDPQGARERAARGPAAPDLRPSPPSARPSLPAAALDVVDEDPRASQSTPAPSLRMSGPNVISASIPIEAESSLEIVTDFEQSIGTGDVVFIQDDGAAELSLEVPSGRGMSRGLDVATPPPVVTNTRRGLDVNTPPPVVVGAARGLDVTPPPVIAGAMRGLDVNTPPPVVAGATRGLDMNTPPPLVGAMRGLDMNTPPPVVAGAKRGLDLSTTPPPVVAGAKRGLDVMTPPPVVASVKRGLDLSTTPPPVIVGLKRGLDVTTPPPVVVGTKRGLDRSTTPPPVMVGTPRGLDVATPPPEIRGALPGLDLSTPPPTLHNAAIDREFRDFRAIDLPRADDVDSARSFDAAPSTLLTGLPIPADELVVVGAEDDELTEDLNQVTFFIDQGMPDEARSLLEDLAARFPHDVRVTNKLRQLDGGVAAAAPMEMSGAQPVTAFPIDDRQATPAPRAVLEGGGQEDVSTRIDLAIAYKEMGLFDAAIAELRPLVDTPNEVLALTMMGECFEAKGSFTEAVIRYKGALNCTPIRPDEMMQLYFLLGAAFERLGDPSEALYFFEKVARRDPRFRDVDRRILALRPKLAKAFP